MTHLFWRVTVRFLTDIHMSLEEKIQATDLHMLSAHVENETCILYLSLLDLTRSLDAKLKIFYVTLSSWVLQLLFNKKSYVYMRIYACIEVGQNHFRDFFDVWKSGWWNSPQSLEKEDSLVMKGSIPNWESSAPFFFVSRNHFLSWKHRNSQKALVTKQHNYK